MTDSTTVSTPSSTTVSDGPAEKLVTIEWHMMDSRRFVTLSLVNSIALRGVLYPLTVVKTRLQVQRHQQAYRGTFNAFVTIFRREGVSALYRGFLINTMQVASGFAYILTYERVRHELSKRGIQDGRLKGLVGGACGSLVAQTIITPFDVVSQHMMVRGGSTSKFGGKYNPLSLDPLEVARYGLSRSIVREIFRRDGLSGFYRGYAASLALHVPANSLWWSLYPMYTDWLMVAVLPADTMQMAVSCIAGPLSGLTVALLTNPLDVLRTNIQVQRLDNYKEAFRIMWSEDRTGMLHKGLSARAVHGAISSIFIVAGYETLKRVSLKDEYKERFKW